MVLLLTDGREEDVKKRQEATFKTRREASRKYHEAIQRGRHPRSFPHQHGVWELVKKSRRRVELVQAGRRLESILGVQPEEAESLVEELKQEESKLVLPSDPTPKPGSILENQADSAASTLKRGKSKPQFGDSVSLARGYTAQYEPSHLRRERISRRMSEYRSTASNGNNKDMSFKPPAKPRSMKRGPTMNGGIGKIQKEKAEDKVVAFLNNARKQGHHRRHGSSIVRFLNSPITGQSKDTKRKDNDSNSSHSSSNSTNNNNNHISNSFAKKKTAINRKSPKTSDTSSTDDEDVAALLSFDFFRDKNKGKEETECIEFAPSNVEGKLFYGSQVALEFHDGSFLTVTDPRGTISLMRHPRKQGTDLYEEVEEEGDGEKAFDDLNPPVYVDKCHTILFTLVNLNDPDYVGPIYSGDDVWLCIHPGQGQFSYKEGSILGSRVTGGATIDTVALEKGKQGSTVAMKESETPPQQPVQAQMTSSDSIGSLLPILTYIPRLPGQSAHAEKSLDDLYRDATNIQRIQKMNRTASHLGQWKICAASNQQIRHFREQQKSSNALDGSSNSESSNNKPAPGMSIANHMPVFLEQDWVYLAAAELDGEEQVAFSRKANAKTESTPSLHAVLKKLPKKLSLGRSQYCIDRQGVFHIRLVQQSKIQTSNTSYKSVEQTLLRARMQLKTSELGRNGNKSYLPNLQSGTEFSWQIRRLREQMENAAEEKYLRPVESLEPVAHKYFFHRYLNTVSESNLASEESSFGFGPFSPQRVSDKLSKSSSTPFMETLLDDSGNKTLKHVASTFNLCATEKSGPVKGTKKRDKDDGKKESDSFERELVCRETEAYKQRLEEQKMTPWYETVFKLKLQDRKIMDEIYSNGKSKQKVNALTLLQGNNSFEKLLDEKKRQKAIEESLSKPIYKRMVEEDFKIKSFVDKAKEGKHSKKSPPNM